MECDRVRSSFFWLLPPSLLSLVLWSLFPFPISPSPPLSLSPRILFSNLFYAHLKMENLSHTTYWTPNSTQFGSKITSISITVCPRARASLPSHSCCLLYHVDIDFWGMSFWWSAPASTNFRCANAHPAHYVDLPSSLLRIYFCAMWSANIRLFFQTN